MWSLLTQAIVTAVEVVHIQNEALMLSSTTELGVLYYYFSLFGVRNDNDNVGVDS